MSTDSGSGVVEVIVAGERLQLLSGKAIFWPARHSLLVADPHFGKAATFRSAGLPVPRGTTAAALLRLDFLIEETGAGRLIFLGDFLHAREGRSAAVFEALAAWRLRHPQLAVTLVRGNHDRRAGDPPAFLGIECVDSPLALAPFQLAHHPHPSPAGYTLAGHLHPCVMLRGAARQSLRLPCFWFGAEVAVLPAFGEFTGCLEVSPRAGDRLWVVTDDEVVAVEQR